MAGAAPQKYLNTMTKHPLDPLLKPGSIALVGASSKKGSPGNVLADLVINSSFEGNVFPVNPGYESIFDLKCYPNLESLPQTVDHVVLAVSNERLERALGDAIAHGARAATIYSSCILEKDSDPPLRYRLTEMAKNSGIKICGGNGMGFYSITQGLYAGVYPMSGEIPQGDISYIAQSGSAFAALSHNGVWLKFNLCVSSGNEFATTVAEYMDWALNQKETRVIALFLETVRDPIAFTNALEIALLKKIPVIVLKVGKSALGARMANTHTGALVGDHSVYQAIFNRYGVIEVSDFDELTATLMLFQSERRPGPGALATLQESGGLRELVVDMAAELNIEFAEINDSTKNEIAQHLEPGLIAENPLDAWGSNEDFENRFHKCMSALMRDPEVAAGMFFSIFRDGYYLSEAFFRVMEKVSGETDKPIAMVNCHSDIDNGDLCRRTAEVGIPFIDGTGAALLAIKHLLFYRDHKPKCDFENNSLPQIKNASKKWHEIFESFSSPTLGEAQALELLSDFEISVPRIQEVSNLGELLLTTKAIGYPLALKTAATEIKHKSDQGGVVLNIADESELVSNYQSLDARLGPDALVCEMVEPGIEIGLGAINDPQFGPVVMVAAGGVLVEILSDRIVRLAPITREDAEEMIGSLKIDKLLKGARGQNPKNRQALIEIIIRFSILVYELRDHIKEIDINPVIVSEDRAVVVDCLVATANS